MAIEQKRIEAAVRFFGGQFDADTMRRLIAAVFPELASDPPTGWVAPVTASDDIDHAIWVAVDIEGTDPMRAARDAHIKEQGE